MNLSLVCIKKFFSSLTLRNSFIITLILCLFIRQPISILFKLLGINNYFYLFCGLFSGLVTYTKSVGNNEVPSKKSLYLSIATGGFVSLFFYFLSFNNLMEYILSIALPLGFSGILENLPSFSYLFEKLLDLKSGKLSLNKARLLEWIKNYLLGSKITPGSNGSCWLPGSSIQTTTHLSERASGKKPDLGGLRNDPQIGLEQESNISNNQFSEIPSHFNYKLFAKAFQEKAEVVILERKQGLNTDGIRDKTVTLLELGINEDSPYYPVFKKFAREYKGNSAIVKRFCTSIFIDRPVKVKIYDDSTYIGSKIFDAISNHK